MNSNFELSEISKYILFRSSPKEFENFEKLNFCGVSSLIEKSIYQEAELKKLSTLLSEKLYILIPCIEDKKIRKIIINARRLIFTLKQLSNKETETLKIYLKAESNLIVSYNQLILEYSHTIKEGERLYETEYQQSKDYLDILVNDEMFLKGLLLSSETLCKHKDKRDNKTIKGLIRYLSRMYAKTSPFSTFTVLNLINITNPKEKEEYKSYISLNNYLLRYIFDLLFSHKQIRQFIPIRKNPTIKVEEKLYRFITTHNNTEMFQKLNRTPAMDIVYGCINETTDIARLSKLVSEKTKNQISQSNVQTYIEQLLDYGFFEFDMGVSGLETEWDITLSNKLQSLHLNNNIIKDLLHSLKKLRNYKTDYTNANFEDRTKILAEAFNEFKTTTKALHMDANLPLEELNSFNTPEEYKNRVHQKLNFKPDEKIEIAVNSNKKLQTNKYKTDFDFTPKKILYEDVQGISYPHISVSEFSGFIEKFSRLINLCDLFEGYRYEKESIREYFIQKFGMENEIDFFEYYTSYTKDILDNPHSKFNFTNLKYKISQEKEDFLGKLKIQLSSQIETNSQEIHLTEEILLNCIDTSKKILPDRKVSAGAFVQFYRNKKNELCGVINSFTIGYGKMISRFMHMTDEEYNQEVRKFNKDITSSHTETIVENIDASYFNANIHQPLADYQIKIPNGHSILPENNQILISNLNVYIDKDTGEIALKDRITNKRIYPLDFGFQGQKGRAPIFRHLNLFTHAYYRSAKSIENAINNWCNKIPRIVYEDTIILQRKSWEIDSKELNIINHTQSKFTALRDLIKWKNELKIPDQIFIKPQYRDKNKRKDNYKPQYINFFNPLLLPIFDEYIDTEEKLILTEMLPAKINKFVNESVIQI